MIEPAHHITIATIRQDTPNQTETPPDLVDRLTSFGFLSAALIVLVFGVFGVLGVLRVYRNRLFRDPTPPTKIVDAWATSAERMPTPPPPNLPEDDSEDGPDGGPTDDDQDDDDGDFPLEPVLGPGSPSESLRH